MRWVSDPQGLVPGARRRPLRTAQPPSPASRAARVMGPLVRLLPRRQRTRSPGPPRELSGQHTTVVAFLDMQRLIQLFFFLGVAALAAPTHAQTPVAHRFIQVAPGVYAAIGNGTIETRDTSGVIINDNDVFLVDTNITPEATRRLVNDIKTLTDKPIRYVVNTHWHYDHADGNQIFGPDVTIIGHENERTAIVGGVLKNRLALEFQN